MSGLYYIISIYKKEGDLACKIKYNKENETNFTMESVYDWTCDLINGIQFLHFNKWIHRDIKPGYNYLFLLGSCNDHDKMMIDQSRSDNFFVATCTCMYYSTLSMRGHSLSHNLVLPQIKFENDKYMELMKLKILQRLKKINNG